MWRNNIKIGEIGASGRADRRTKLSDPARNVLSMKKPIIPPPPPGHAHPALRRVLAALEAIDRVDTSRLSVAEHAALIVEAEALQLTLQRVQARLVPRQRSGNAVS